MELAGGNTLHRQIKREGVPHRRCGTPSFAAYLEGSNVGLG